MKKQVVYTDELNIVVDQLNSLTRAIHRAYMRNADSIDTQKSKLRDIDDKRKELKDELDSLTSGVSSIQEIQVSQSNFIKTNQETLDNIDDIINSVESVETVKNPQNYVTNDGFDALFNGKLQSIGDTFSLGASEISIGNASDDGRGGSASLKYVSDADGGAQAVSLGVDGSRIKITNSGLQYCTQEDCTDIVPTPAPSPGGQ